MIVRAMYVLTEKLFLSTPALRQESKNDLKTKSSSSTICESKRSHSDSFLTRKFSHILLEAECDDDTDELKGSDGAVRDTGGGAGASGGGHRHGRHGRGRGRRRSAWRVWEARA